MATQKWSRVAGIFRSAFSPLRRRPLPRLVVPSELKLDGEVVGSSHGWVAVFDKRQDQLFLSDPVSNHCVNLPPIRTFSDPHLDSDVDGCVSVSKVALSSSPNDDDSRAVAILGSTRRLAFCSPRHSSEWTALGDSFFEIDYDHEEEAFFYERQARVHADLVYRSKRKVLTAITAGDLNLRFLVDKRWISFGIGDYHFLDNSRVSERYDWNLEDPNSPKLVRSEKMEGGCVDEDAVAIDWVAENLKVLENECVQIPHLIYAEDEDEGEYEKALFIAVRFVRLMNRDSLQPLGFVPRCEYRGLAGLFPGKTYGFVVMAMYNAGERRFGEGRFRVVDGEDNLNGMTMFVGINHSSPSSVVRDRRFKPNSIYFTDAKRIERVSGLNDCGIFDYATKTFCPSHLLHHHHAPSNTHSSFWFT